jgi:hypothetical protein
MKKGKNETGQGWWYARFRITWPENTEPSWHIDLLIADKIIAPVLSEHNEILTLWRFHRRAARDQEGHQFSFTFYASPSTAEQVFSDLKSSSLLKKMKHAGLIIKDIYDDTNRITASEISDTSDGNWAPVIKKSWPYFIMGVCQMWLTLVTEVADDLPDIKQNAALSKLILRYRQINETVKSLWREQGSHALLHHLNAIFGYEPVLVREAHLRRF